MAFLRINGLAVDALIDNFDIEDVSVEEYVRGVSDSLEGLTYSIKRQITFTTPPMTADDAYSLEGWVRGRQHFWNFQRPDTGTTRFSLSSADAALTLGNGTANPTTLFGAFGMRLDSASTANATTSFGSEGDWTVHFYHRVGSGATFSSYGAVSRNGSISAWTAGASATTIQMCSISAASGYLGVSLLGRNAAGTTTSCHFANLTVARYALSTDMFMSLASAYYGTPTTNWTRPPFVTVTGSCLQTHQKTCNEALEKGPMVAHATVEGISLRPVVMNGSLVSNARQLTIRLLEK